MKISELQEKLKAICDKHGDIEVWSSCGGPHGKIEVVEYYNGLCLIERPE